MIFFAADSRDHVAKDNFPLKQEGCEPPQAQKDGAGKCLLFVKTPLKQLHLKLNLKLQPFLGVSASSLSLKNLATTDPHDSDADKSEGIPS